MTVSKLAELASLSLITVTDPDREVFGAYVGDLLSWVMGRAQEGNAWITIMSNINITAVASLSDVACIILAEGVSLDSDVIATATSKSINILSSEMSAYELCVNLSELLK